MSAPNDGSTPHWEHGHRMHGLWLGPKRLGWVGIPPHGYPLEYHWGLDRTPNRPAVAASSLRAAKRAVERALGYGPGSGLTCL